MPEVQEQWPPFTIYPDMVLYVPEKGKVLIEIANPRSAKRFIGEMVYPQILGHFKKIVAAIIFVLPSGKTKAYRGMVQNQALHLICEKQIPTVTIGWPGEPEEAYLNLKYALTKQLFPE